MCHSVLDVSKIVSATPPADAASLPSAYITALNEMIERHSNRTSVVFLNMPTPPKEVTYTVAQFIIFKYILVLQNSNQNLFIPWNFYWYVFTMLVGEMPCVSGIQIRSLSGHPSSPHWQTATNNACSRIVKCDFYCALTKIQRLLHGHLIHR